MKSLRIDKVNDSLTITLSAEMSKKLQVGEGDIILAIETTNGIELIPSDPVFELGMEAYRKVASRYTNALQELAK